MSNIGKKIIVWNKSGKKPIKVSELNHLFGSVSFLKNTKNQTEPIESSLVRTLDSPKADPNRSNYTPLLIIR
jgi:hypothetical protein